MRKNRLSLAKQDRLAEHFVAGTTARCAAALIGVNSKTAVYYFHRLPKEHFGLFLKECEWRFNTPDPQEQLRQIKQWVRLYLT